MAVRAHFGRVRGRYPSGSGRAAATRGRGGGLGPPPSRLLPLSPRTLTRGGLRSEAAAASRGRVLRGCLTPHPLSHRDGRGGEICRGKAKPSPGPPGCRGAAASDPKPPLVSPRTWRGGWGDEGGPGEPRCAVRMPLPNGDLPLSAIAMGEGAGGEGGPVRPRCEVRVPLLIRYLPCQPLRGERGRKCIGGWLGPPPDCWIAAARPRSDGDLHVPDGDGRGRAIDLEG